MDISRNSVENQLTLTFLSNPQYHLNLKRNEMIGPDEHEQKFYRRRVLSLHKDMLRGAVPDKNIKHIHDNYVSNLINYFKMIDKKDILQEEYNNLSVENVGICKNYDVSNANILLMDQNTKPQTLDKFVKKIKLVQDSVPPQQKKINLKADKLRNKGIKIKKPKKENVT
tara:strand:+ start:286 stop:792 length:507 start_codon:yes stop_codon:yes gene_type:complete